MRPERIGASVHGTRIGTIVALKGGDDSLARRIAMHVGASSPQYVNPSDVPADVVAKEREILTAQAASEGKPAAIVDKMVEGRLRKYLAEICLTGHFRLSLVKGGGARDPVLKWPRPETKTHYITMGMNEAKWTDDTTKATEKFIAGYNKDAKHKVKLAAGLAATAKNDKKWSPDLWKAAFTLYQEDICTALKIAPPDPAKLPLRTVRFAVRGRECVACGESFPLKVDKSGYQKDKYRRVDIMFWNPKEVPGVRKGSRPFVCPAAGAAAHQSKTCPIWYQKHLKAVYLDPDKQLKLMAPGGWS